MNNTVQTAHYEESITLLCEEAKQSSNRHEGFRDESGCPCGGSTYSLIAKLLWRFQKDGIQPVTPMKDLKEFPSFYDVVVHAFTSLYVIKPETPIRNGEPSFSDYILRSSAT